MPIITHYLPILDWLGNYRRADLPGDLIAGLIVTIMLVPQGMAYAMLAGLPPQVGLYASVLPLIFYAVFGSSRTLAVGPVAVVSLMTASALADIGGTENQLAGALILALASGLLLLIMGVARLGFLVNFLSHPVISGFTSAAALVIGFSQLKHLLGMEIPRSHLLSDIIGYVIDEAESANIVTVALGAGLVALLLLWRGPLGGLLLGAGVMPALTASITKAGPLAAVILGAGIVWLFGLDQSAGVKIVGAIPAGLPSLQWPGIDMEMARDLLPAAALIALVGFVESVSVAKSLAAKRRQTIDADQELRALGVANIGAAISGGYPVTGGFSRSVVNFTAGANTGLAAIVTALLIAFTLAFLTPLFHFLPKAALAAIIVVAVAKLVDYRSFIRTWRYNGLDGFSQAATFAAVLSLGVELGIMIGAALAIALYLWRTSRPHMAVVGRVGETEHFRNILRHEVKTLPHVLALRVDENLYFANSKFLEEHLFAAVADHRRIEHLVLICSAINFIDASALESLQNTVLALHEAGVTVHLAEVKGPVMDMLEKSDFLSHLGAGEIFLSTHEAIDKLERAGPADA
ncbi:MAG: sulfate permease [Alphaproteobacteria bacterium]|jgi:SulP family sulfate permease|nr:sulfate permease [Alphaproteobacteria bacterium]MDP6817063.1 sulfate permease [Alphaproteobacteria bacterium]